MSVRYRDRMIEEMQTRALNGTTQKEYLTSMLRFTEFYKKPPAKLGIEDIKAYQRHLVKEEYAANSINRHLSAIRFFYRHVLNRHWYADALPRLKSPRKSPKILSQEEVALMIDSVHKVFYKAVIMTLYSAGLRHAELRGLQQYDIDSQRMVIHVRNGKGQRQRQALLSPITLKCLRTYWRLYRVNAPYKSKWLFTPTKNSRNGNFDKPLSHTAVGYILRTAAKAAGIKKKSIPTY
jgi:integrase/recombinase XerD